jgi:uncharacterized protein (DUF885 family)
MKYLLKNLKAVSKGEDLEAGKTAQAAKNELVFDPAGTHKLAELKAIATANKVEHPAKAKMPELVPLITAAFEAKNLPERINIKAIVVAGVEADKSDDQIMMELIEAGVHVKDAWGQFRAALMGAGLLLNPTERAEKLAELLKGFEPITGVDVSTKLSELMEAVPRTTDRQGMAAIRKFSKDNSIELPVVKRIGGWKKKLFDWITEHPSASQEEMAAYVSELGRPDTIARRYAEIMTLVNRVAERLTPAE